MSLGQKEFELSMLLVVLVGLSISLQCCNNCVTQDDLFIQKPVSQIFQPTEKLILTCELANHNQNSSSWLYVVKDNKIKNQSQTKIVSLQLATHIENTKGSYRCCQHKANGSCTCSTPAEMVAKEGYFPRCRSGKNNFIAGQMIKIFCSGPKTNASQEKILSWVEGIFPENAVNETFDRGGGERGIVLQSSFIAKPSMEQFKCNLTANLPQKYTSVCSVYIKVSPKIHNVSIRLATIKEGQQVLQCQVSDNSEFLINMSWSIVSTIPKMIVKLEPNGSQAIITFNNTVQRQNVKKVNITCTVHSDLGMGSQTVTINNVLNSTNHQFEENKTCDNNIL